MDTVGDDVCDHRTISGSLNGHLLDPFTPTRGLRQGDPLSPYLFLFLADGLSSLIQDSIARGALHDLRICRRAPGISHLLFADDSLLFFQGNPQQALIVKEILDTYERCTGQLVSLGKCSILFGDKCTPKTNKLLRGFCAMRLTVLRKYI
jgi:hypothetical protein